MIIVEQPKSLIFKNKLFNILKSTFIISMICITYFPLFIIALSSINLDSTGNDFYGFTFEWYGAMVDDSNLMEAITNTLVIAILSTAISTVFGTITAIGINSLNRKKRKALIFLNNIPIINADIVTGIFLLLIFTTIGTLIGIEFILGFWTLLIAHVLFSTPYVVLSVLPKLSEMDDNLFDAALDLGCRPYYALRKIILPSIKAGILSGMLLAFTMSIDDFTISYFTSGSVSNFSTWLYGNRKRFDLVWTKVCAYNTIITITSIIGIIVYHFIKNKKGNKKNA